MDQADARGINVTFAYPVPTSGQAALLASYELLLPLTESLLPVTVPGVPGRLFFEDWEITRAALIARMAGTLRHLGYLAPSQSRLDGVALSRTLVEHAITFGWISADPPEHLPRFLRTNFSRNLDVDKRFRANAQPMLADALRTRYREYVRTYTDDMPGVRNQAEEADKRWLVAARSAMPDPLQLPSLVELYDMVYDHFASLDHPSVNALQMFVHATSTESGASVDGEPERDRDTDLRPYWLALWSFVWALSVSTNASGCPPARELRRAVSHARALREFDRHGLLAISQHENTMIVGLVPDADERIAHIEASRRANA